MKDNAQSISNKQAPILAAVGLVFLAAGLLLGWLFFRGNPTTTSMAQHEVHDHEVTSGSSIYTCSMHPQIRQGEPGDCPICGMDLIPVSEGGGEENSDPARLEMTTAAVAMANIQTTQIGVGSTSGFSDGKSIELNGAVKMDERRLTSQVAHVAGRIEKLYVNSTGEQVRKGQRLASIYSPDLVTAQEEFLQAKKVQATLPALLEATKEKLRQWKFTEAQIAQLESTGKVSRAVTVYAEASGIVTERKVSLGDYVQTGQALLEISNLSRLWVEFEVYEKDLSSMKIGSLVTFSLGEKELTQQVTYIDPVIDPTTRIGKIRVEVSNAKGNIRPETFVKGEVAIAGKKESTDVLLVPQSAVLWTGKRSMVYVAIKDSEVPAFEGREVVLGERVGEQFQVTSGLKSGERVVTYGAFTVDAAAQLNNKFSMMNRDVFIRAEAAASKIKPSRFSETEVPKIFSEKILTVYEPYLKMKDALVASDAELAGTHAAAMKAALEKIEPDLLSGKALVAWQKDVASLTNSLSKFTSNKSLEGQREVFLSFSDKCIRLIREFGLSYTATIYVQYCPMADDYNGGYWLSNETEIMNPYFGDKMLHCGEVEDTLKF